MVLVALPALIVIVLSVAGFFGAFWWPLDLLANFRFQAGATLVILGLALLIGRWRRIGWITLLVGAVNLAFVAPLYLPSEQPAGLTADIRVISINVEANNDDYESLADLIRTESPDVVFLHESTRLWEAAMAEADLGLEVYSGRAPDMIFSTMVLAPAGTEVEGFGFTQTEPRAIEVILDTEEGPISLLGIHPLSPSTETRSSLRDAQLRYAGEWAADQSGPAIVVGDFNATPWSAAFRRVIGPADLQNSQRGFGYQATFPDDGSPLVRLPIDHLVHSRDLIVLDRRLGPDVGSDHLPIIVDLAVAP